ncbi:MAG TPA: hypothetical protein PKW90_09370 [Myxococcota bacterium]|nr:hypothetical protein [Myxococcota bacterium]
MGTTGALYGEVPVGPGDNFRNFSIARRRLIHSVRGPIGGQLGFLSFKLKFFSIGAYGKIGVLYG